MAPALVGARKTRYGIMARRSRTEGFIKFYVISNLMDVGLVLEFGLVKKFASSKRILNAVLNKVVKFTNYFQPLVNSIIA